MPSIHWPLNPPRAPLGVTVAAGRPEATMLTLVVIPVVYTLLDGLQRWILKPFRREGASAEGRGP